MLVQVVALLSLGVLHISVPMPTGTTRHSVGSIIQEVLESLQKLNLKEVPSLATVNTTVERCMRSHLETFAASLENLNTQSKLIVRQLNVINKSESIPPKDLGEECKTVQVPGQVFLETLESFLRLLSEAFSYFLPLKETPHLQNKTKSIIDEMLCLLEAEKDPINEEFSKPLHIKSKSCAHYNTEKFIKELKKIPQHPCMKIVEKCMRKLEEKCSILKKSSPKDERCSDKAETDFSRFKESLEEFLKWVNQKQNCSNIMRNDLYLYLDDKCSCLDSWKYHKGLL
ncbi:PREDICTED: uncharacterized protein LOC104271585 [Apaloderma vittatum]|uniref:uncharacterized protein LOC104271585 n=1 Tax=Apaloderma vittatum TaxID=57397 RepID=UPI00052146F7|nr:PREDICTED: uncharacterized protein LOC104271585 [Apaloderma vittatum]